MTVTSKELDQEEKKYLRRIGHGLKPIITIAGKGFSAGVQTELERALNDHELIKVKLAISDREQRRQVLSDMQTNCGAQLVQAVGHMALLLRKSEKPNPRLSNLLRATADKAGSR